VGTPGGRENPTGRIIVIAATEEVADGAGRQGGLAQESHRRARRDHVGEVLLGVGGHQYHRRTASVPMELLGKFEAALRAEIDVDQYHLRPQLFGAPERLGAGCGHADDRDPLELEQATRGLEERRVVIDD